MPAAPRRRSAFLVAQSDAEQALRCPRHKEIDDDLARKICRDLGNRQAQMKRIANRSGSEPVE
jgi:hypothetical protein